MSDEHDYAMTTPTLMIGLGGLGCSIVQSVYSDLPQGHRAYTRAHVMDTDVAELKDARYDELHNNGWHTQTSPNLTVQECIQRLKLGASVTHWFPPIGLGSLGHKLMPKGAAQVRAVSRLALLDTINSDRVVALNRNIDSLLEEVRRSSRTGTRADRQLDCRGNGIGFFPSSGTLRSRIPEPGSRAQQRVHPWLCGDARGLHSQR